MDKLTKANEYIKEHHVEKEKLPVFHITPPCGWMNDPNGFSVYGDRIHLFYQFHPYSEVWGPMHWGHCESIDFVKWTELPVALAPDQSYDDAGCFSGSGIETENGHVLIYTGVVEKEINGEKQTFQNQCMAVGDGKTYKKRMDKAIVTGDMLPEGFSREHFRDPKIWKEEDGYYMVVGNKTVSGIPQVVLFHSDNLENWQYVSVLARDDKGKLGTMWECPDFFELDGDHILITSPQDLSADEELHCGNNTVYYTGIYDKNRHTFDYRDIHSLDDGLDFYAAQTMQAKDGRRILIGWMQSWDSNIRPSDQKWAGMMTLPRELRLKNGILLQNPVREIETYYKHPVYYMSKEISGKCSLDGICGRVMDMTMEITDGDFREFSICFAENDRHHTRFTYDKAKNMLEMDRTYCGMIRDAAAIRRVKVRHPHAQMKIRIILDKFSAEIFINDGEQVLSTTYYTPTEADGIHFECDGTAVVNLQKYEISVD